MRISLSEGSLGPDRPEDTFKPHPLFMRVFYWEDHEMRTSIKIALGIVIVFVLLLVFIPAFGGHPHLAPFNTSTNSTTNATTAFANYTNYTMRYGAHGASLQGIIRRLINEIRSSVE